MLSTRIHFLPHNNHLVFLLVFIKQVAAKFRPCFWYKHNFFVLCLLFLIVILHKLVLDYFVTLCVYVGTHHFIRFNLWVRKGFGI